MSYLLALSLLVVGALHVEVSAQNLVPNPSFESYSNCPTADFQFDGFVDDWRSATVPGSPDYFNACNTSPCSQGVPAARYGSQTPHNATTGGKAFAGIYHTNIGLNYREYMKTTLRAPLVEGKWYAVKFYVSLAEASPIGIMNLGAYIGTNAPTAKTYIYPATPQIVHPQFITGSDGWVEISGMYQAQGGENSLVIGCFDQELRTTPSNAPGACSEVKWGGAYYYIDDVSIVEAAAPTCTSTEDRYDITFAPSATSSNGECCWTVIAQAKQSACPLYGVSVILPSGTVLFTWKSTTPIVAGEELSIGDFCFAESDESRNVTIAYLDADDRPFSSTTRELSCGYDCLALQVRVESLDAGTTDYCGYDLYIENTSGRSMELSEIALDIPGGTFNDAVAHDWTISLEKSTSYLRWSSGSTPGIIPPHGTIHIGTFGVDYTSGPQKVTAYLYREAYDSDKLYSCTQDLQVECSLLANDCADYIHAELTPQRNAMLATSTSCFDLSVRQDRDIDCRIAGVSLSNSTPEIAAEWSLHDLQAPVVFTEEGTTIGSICFDPTNAPTLYLTYWDDNGNVIHTEQLRTARPSVPDGDKSIAGVGTIADAAASLGIAPNPARDLTTITYTLARSGYAKLEVFDLNGALVDMIPGDHLPAGTYSFQYQAGRLPAGTYRIRLSSDGYAALAPLIVVR